MATITVKDGGGSDVALEKPLAPGRAAAASSRPIAVSTEDKAVLDAQAASLATLATASAATTPVLAPSASTLVSGAITTAMTATTSTSLLAAAGASTYNYITTIIVSNSHATVGTNVLIQDGSGGATLLTIPAAAVYGGAVITLPVPLKQPTANTALFAQNETTGASTKVSVVGYKGA